MRNFPSIKEPKEVGIGDSEELVVEEKLDGANFRFTVTESGEFLFGSRNVVFKENGEPIDLDQVNKTFRHAVKYVENTAETFDSQYTVYGEALHKHSIDYDAWDGNHPDPQSTDVPNVVVFDVWNGEEWLTPSEVREFCEDHNLDFVGVVDRVESLDNVEIPQSQYRERDEDAETEFDREGLAEGVVIKDPATGDRAKYVHESFRETRPSGDGDTDAHEFVHRFVTEARVEKQAHKLVDEGNYDQIKMEMMQDLPQAVIEDVLSEEGWTIMTDEHGIELTEDTKGKIRSDTSSKCANILKQLLHSI